MMEVRLRRRRRRTTSRTKTIKIRRLVRMMTSALLNLSTSGLAKNTVKTMKRKIWRHAWKQMMILLETMILMQNRKVLVEVP